MKKYTRPTIEVVELSVRESLSGLPGNFADFGIAKPTVSAFSSARKNLTMYKVTSITTPAQNS